MREALRLARRGTALVSPNPLVGAVVVNGGRVVGHGYHRRYGGPHAEIFALREAGEQARGATLYVNLEPCHHRAKQTPPCTAAIRAAGIRRMVTAMEDPHPAVSGRGHRALARAGIRVSSGVCQLEACELNECYLKFVRTHLPFVALKLAQTLDGKIATETGESRWITGLPARRWVHRLRGQFPALMVGVGTVLRDDPDLTIRLCPPPRADGFSFAPLRVVVDGRLKTPVTTRLVETAREVPTLILTTPAAPTSRERALEARGVQVLRVKGDAQGRMDLESGLRTLGRKGISSVLVEGGQRMATHLLKEGWIDRLYLLVAPKILGGSQHLLAFADLGLAQLDQSIVLQGLTRRSLGQDTVFSGYPSTARWRPGWLKAEGHVYRID